MAKSSDRHQSERMPVIFVPGARAALIRLTCAKCGEVQARAKGPPGTERTCRKCGSPLAHDGAHPERARRT